MEFNNIITSIYYEHVANHKISIAVIGTTKRNYKIIALMITVGSYDVVLLIGCLDNAVNLK